MKKFYFLIIIVLLFSCFQYVYYDQKDVLLKNIDMDQTLDIAVMELNDGGFTEVLGLWVIRDQVITPDQAKRINDIYFKYVDNLKEEFSIWHFAWAISNFYRNGSDEIKTILQKAYNDAVTRPDKLKKFKKIANQLVNDKKIYMGNIHSLGMYYAHTHIIVKGDKDYIQSIDEYKKTKEKDNKWLKGIKI